MIVAKSFYMIRHGESSANAEKVLAGQTQTPLTERGIQQAIEERSILDSLSHKPTVIIHSHLPRAKHTAEILNENLKLPMVSYPDIQEQCFGEWERMHYDDVIPLLRENMDPPNGESVIEFNKRVQRAKNDILSYYERPMLVCHGGVFFAFFSLYKQPLDWVENARLYYFTPDDNDVFPWHVTEAKNL